MEHYLVEMTVYDPAISGTRVLYFSTHDYTTRPTDTPPNQHYMPLVSQPGNYEEAMFASGKTFGASTLGFGEVRLANTTGSPGTGGPLDALIDYGFDGRTIVFKKITILGAVLLLASCSMEQPEFTNSEVVIRIKDPQMILNTPVQATKYAGNNQLPNGVEGTDDIKGKPKPLTYGRVFNVTPVQVNTSKLIYQVHESAADVPAVYDRGVGLLRGDDYADLTAMQSVAPDPGTYRVCPVIGCFRLGSSASGQLTADVVEGATPADRTAAQVAKRIAQRVISTGDITAADVAALDVANCSEVGIYMSEETTTMAALDQVLGSVGAWYGFDQGLMLGMAQFTAPAGEPEVTLTDADCLSIDRVASSDPGRGISPYQVSLTYNKNYTMQTSDLAGNLLSLPKLWSPAPAPATGMWNGCAYGNGIFVAVPFAGSSFGVSNDGRNWTLVPVPAGSIWCITFGAGTFVAIAHNTGMAYSSTDGITWAPHVIPGTLHNWTSVVYDGTQFIAIGGSSSYTIHSPDGITWSSSTNLPVGAPYTKIVSSGNGILLITGDVALSQVSTDGGITWTTHTMPAGSWRGLTFGNGLFAAVGYSSNAIITSPDGITWSSTILPNATYWTDIAYGGGVFVTIASGTNFAAYSLDGIAWTVITLPDAYAWGGLGFGDNRFLIFDSIGNEAIYQISPGYLHKRWIAQEYRTVLSTDTSVLVAHPLSPVITINTLLVEPAAAQAEADRLLALYKPRRDTLQVQVKTSVLPFLAKGKQVLIRRPRYGYDAGRLMRCIGSTVDRQQGVLTLTLWG